MHHILQNLHINANSTDIHAALSTIDGLASWWTRTTDGSTAVGDSIHFRFGAHVTTMRVDRDDSNHVAWTVTDGAPEWVGTRLTFEVVDDDGRALLKFGHRDWREPSDFFGHCSMKWSTFLWSLKHHLERGEGQPFPDDVAI